MRSTRKKSYFRDEISRVLNTLNREKNSSFSKKILRRVRVSASKITGCLPACLAVGPSACGCSNSGVDNPDSLGARKWPAAGLLARQNCLNHRKKIHFFADSLQMLKYLKVEKKILFLLF